MKSIKKNAHIDKLHDIVHNYNNSYHKTITKKPVGSTYIDQSVENNDKDSKFEVVDHVRISKYENIFAKVYTQNWSKKVFIVKNFLNTAPWILVILTMKKLLKHFTTKNYNRQIRA